MDDHYTHLADLAAFVRLLDLPPLFRPFIKTPNHKKDKGEEDTQTIVFKILGTTDSYYAIMIKKETTVELVEQKIRRNLGVVKLTDEAKKKLKELLEKLRCGEFVHFINPRFARNKYPYKHQ